MRPQFHFTAPKNWLNDPNGLIYLDGEYHLFYQYNPDFIGHAGQNMHWGHAVSSDLLSWRHLPIAIPNKDPHQAYSGSAILDENNLLKLNQDGVPAIAAYYTRTGVGQCLAASSDRGRTWTEILAVIPYADDAARQRTDRDPRVFLHAPSNAYILVLYERTGYSFYRSTNLLDWSHASYLDGYYECPELLELPVLDSQGNVPSGASSNQTRWVLFDGDGTYVVGFFDGFTFTPESPKLASDAGPHFYATQCWLNAPDGRVIQIAWMRGGAFENAGYSQQMSIPCELSLRQDSHGAIYLHRLPIRELQAQDILLDQVSSLHLPGRYRIRLRPDASDLRFSIRGHDVDFRARYRTLSFAGRVIGFASNPSDRPIEIVLDHHSIELFIDEGRRSISFSIPVGPA